MLSLHVIQARYGDSLILEHADTSGHRYILVDGGPGGVFENSLRPALLRIAQSGGMLDLVVLSHVDNDHVVGLLDLFADLGASPGEDRTGFIGVGRLWHNAFSGTLGHDVDTRVRRLRMSRAGPTRRWMPRTRRVTRGIAEGDELTTVSTRAGTPINPGFGPDHVVSTDAAAGPVTLGELKLHIVGPTRVNLDNLRAEWLEWLAEQEQPVVPRDATELRRVARAADQRVPNLSSIMILADACGKTVLVTGDGRGDHLLQGLEQSGLLSADGTVHVNVLKMPHHGSQYNVSKDFLRKVTADRYVLSASGYHGHPSIHTLRWLVQAAQEQNRPVEIFATNETKSTRQIRAECDPDSYGYRLVVMDPQIDSHVLRLSG